MQHRCFLFPSCLSSFSLAAIGSEGQLQTPVSNSLSKKPELHTAYRKILCLFSRDVPRTGAIWGKTEWLSLSSRCLNAALQHGRTRFCDPFAHTPRLNSGSNSPKKSHKEKLVKPGSISKQMFHILCSAPAAHSRHCCWIQIVKGPQNRACCSSVLVKSFSRCCWHWAVWSLPRQAAPYTGDVSCGSRQVAYCHSVNAGKGPPLG